MDGSVTIKSIYSHIITGAVCGSLTFGVSQIWAVHPIQEQVRVNAQEIVHLRESDEKQQKLIEYERQSRESAIAGERVDITSRMQIMANLVTSVLDNQKELIALIKVQNQIK